MTATVTSRGQLTIPAAERRRLGLRTGTRVNFEVTTETKVSTLHSEMPRNKSPVSAIKGFFPKPERAVTLEEMDEAIGCGRKQKW